MGMASKRIRFTNASASSGLRRRILRARLARALGIVLERFRIRLEPLQYCVIVILNAEDDQQRRSTRERVSQKKPEIRSLDSRMMLGVASNRPGSSVEDVVEARRVERHGLAAPLPPLAVT